MEFKNREIRDLWGIINEVSPKNIGKASFKWGIALNKGVFKLLMAALLEAAKSDDKFLEFDKKRVEEVQKLASRDEQGNFITRNTLNPITKQSTQEYIVDPSKQVALGDALEVLRGEYKEVLAAEELHQKEFLVLLEKTVEVEVHLINREDVPVDDLTPDQLYALMPLIVEVEEPESTKEKKE